MPDLTPSPAALFGLLLRDALRLRHPIYPSDTHLRAVLAWLSRAQDASGCGGLSYAFGLKRGWLPPYPETAGYLIPTLYEAADHLGEPGYADRAGRMARWLLGLQMPAGAFSGGTTADPPGPEVFNTGMIIFGLVAAFRRTGEGSFLSAAEKAGRWLAGVQDPDGAWRTHSFQGIPHAYHTRVAWALLDLHSVAPAGGFSAPALRALRWAQGQQRPDGWLDRCAFEEGVPPYTHTIAYALRGFLECGLILGDGDLVRRAAGPAEILMRRFEASGILAATYGPGWRRASGHSCLTGDAQFAHLFLRLFEALGDVRFLNASLKLNDQVKSTQNLSSRNPGVRGGIKGSHPVWGAYLPYRYPNWSAKFFADALMLEAKLMKGLETTPPSPDRASAIPSAGREKPEGLPSGLRARLPSCGLSVVLMTGRSRNPNAYPLAVFRGLRAAGLEVRGVVFEEATRANLRKLLGSASVREAASRVLRRARMLTLDRWRALRRQAHSPAAPVVFMRDDLRRAATPYHAVQDHNGPRCLRILRRWRPDLTLLLGTRVIRGSVLKTARVGVINLHPGQLPDCRGVDTVEWALLEGRPLAVTAHLVDRGVDTGPVLLRRTFSPDGIATLAEAREAVSRVAAEVAVEAVVGLRDGSIAPVPQPKVGGRQYFRMHERLKGIVKARMPVAEG